MRYHTIAFAIVCGALLAGCERPKPTENAPTAIRASAIRERALREFARADYYKPAETDVSPADVRLAPLIVQEEITGRVSEQPICGVIRQAADWHYDARSPAVYFSSGTAVIRAGAFQQTSYLWCYGRSPAPDAFVTRWRGVRMTFNSRGEPVVWEAMAEFDPVIVMFVARSLEEKAAKQFGSALEGRKFAVERSIRDQPSVVVARILEDGPEPMGPFVYVGSDRDEITTVLCRCMPSQFSDVAKTHEYRLEELSRVAGVAPRNGGLSGRLDRAVPDSICDLVPNVPDCARPDWLDVALRLPADF